ncbi:MAG: AraC family transcriptional regulator [Victivallales bacterium]
MKFAHIHFNTLDSIESFPYPTAIGVETRDNTSAYHLKGKNRTDPNHCIFQYTLSGYGCFRDAGGEHVLRPGSGFLCESRDRAISYYYPESSRIPWRFVYVAFSGETSFLLLRNMVRRFGPVYSLSLNHPVIARIQSYFEHMEKQQVISASEGSRLVVGILNTLTESREERKTDEPENLLLRRAVGILGSHAGGTIKVSQLARRSGVSREHLTRIFTQMTGLPPHQFINRRKIMEACSILENGKPSIKEVSDTLGYKSAAHFTRTFKRVMNKTPSEYMRDKLMPSL